MLNMKFSFLNFPVMLGTVFFLYTFHSMPAISENFADEPGTTPPEASIELTITEETNYTFTGVLVNNLNKEIEYSYQLSGKRTGKSGTSKSSQGGQVLAKPGEKTILSKFSVNISPGDEFEVILDIYHDDLHIAADTLSHTP